MKKNIVVFPCGSEIGLEICKALAYSTHFELFGASSDDNNHGKYVFKNYISGLPFVDEKNFINELNKLITKYKIDFIVPAHDSVVLKLAENSKKLKCKLITSPYEACKISRSKSLTYKFFEKSISTPKIYKQKDKIKYPVFLKPDIGQGSKGVYKAENTEELSFYLKKDPSLLILEYLPGKELTVDCFTDRKGKLLFIGPRERIRISNGISVRTKNFEDVRIDKIAKIINSKLKLQGCWFFQLKLNSRNQYTLMEVAPRIAGAMGMYRNLGINFIALSIFDKMNLDVSIAKNSFNIEMDRALSNKYLINIEYDTVYIDFDDTIITGDGKVNNLMILFLYQCLNNNKKIILITKHKENIEKTLKKYKIERNIFSKIIHLSPKEEKSLHFDAKKAIFIDDSFAEREKILKKHKIPVFDVHAIESLIDWRN